MTAHDPALVERLADAFWRDRAGIENVLDLLAAEGWRDGDEVDRLHTRIGELTPHRPVPNSSEWPIPDTSCADADRAADEQIAGLLADCHRLAAERDRLRAALAEVKREVMLTLSIVEEALADPSPELHSGPDGPHVAPEVMASVRDLTPDWAPDGVLSPDWAEPLIDPDCRDGKHSSCVGAPCECQDCEHPR